MSSLNSLLIFVLSKIRTPRILLKEILKDGIYIFPTLQRAFKTSPTVHQSTASVNSDLVPIWHAHMGYASIKTIKQILNDCHISANSFFCDSCAVPKIHQLPFDMSQTKCSHPLELVYMDI